MDEMSMMCHSVAESSTSSLIDVIEAQRQEIKQLKEREEPKKAIKIDALSSQACPTCKSNVCWRYCPHCGQKISY